MKKYFLAVFTFVLLVSIGCTDNAAKDNPKSSQLTWVENLEQGIKTAKAEDKQILVNFTGSDWCIWCKRLNSEVFSQKEFADYAKKNLVLVKVDFPRNIEQSHDTKLYNNNLMRQFGVRGFPTIILLDSEGKFVGQTGYQQGGATNYVKHIQEYYTKS